MMAFDGEMIIEEDERKFEFMKDICNVVELGLESMEAESAWYEAVEEKSVSEPK